jgi:hypothetical protein
MNMDAAKALLGMGCPHLIFTCICSSPDTGSPNGQAAGYFLAQHKHRFGRSKTISRVQVFRPDKGIMPYLLFWVADAPPATSMGEGQERQQIEGDSIKGAERKVRNETHVSESRIVKRGMDGKRFVREHVFQANI